MVGVLEIKKPLQTVVVPETAANVQCCSISFPYIFYLSNTVKPTLEHKIKDVSVSTRNVSQIFTPQPNGQIMIDCNDTQKGEAEKKCKLVLLDKFGKQVRVPFKFK